MAAESTTGTITIRTTTEILEALGKLAESMDRTRNWVIEAALRSYLETQAWQIKGVEEALAALERGEGVAHENVMSDLDKLLNSTRE